MFPERNEASGSFAIFCRHPEQPQLQQQQELELGHHDPPSCHYVTARRTYSFRNDLAGLRGSACHFLFLRHWHGPRPLADGSEFAPRATIYQKAIVQVPLVVGEGRVERIWSRPCPRVLDHRGRRGNALINTATDYDDAQLRHGQRERESNC